MYIMSRGSLLFCEDHRRYRMSSGSLLQWWGYGMCTVCSWYRMCGNRHIITNDMCIRYVLHIGSHQWLYRMSCWFVLCHTSGSICSVSQWHVLHGQCHRMYHVSTGLLVYIARTDGMYIGSVFIRRRHSVYTMYSWVRVPINISTTNCMCCRFVFARICNLMYRMSSWFSLSYHERCSDRMSVRYV